MMIATVHIGNARDPPYGAKGNEVPGDTAVFPQRLDGAAKAVTVSAQQHLHPASA